MGGLGTTLGYIAGGFEQSRQADLQRQFEDIQNRRAQQFNLLGKLAMDEAVHPDVRQWAIQSAIEGAQAPLSKKWEPKWNDMPVPKGTPQQSFTPPPSPPMQLPGGISLPPPPPQTATLAAQPGHIFMSPQEHTQMMAQRTGQMAGAEAGGTLQSQIGARQAALAGMPPLPPEETAAFTLGVPIAPFMRSVGTGGGFAGELRSQGYQVPSNIKDDQWVDVRQLGGGQTTFTPGAGPGQKAGDNGKLIGPLAYEQQKQSIDLPFYQKKIGMQLAKSLDLQQNAFNLAIQSGALKDADKIYSQNWSDLKQRQGALSLMEQNYQQALLGNQQAMVSLLFNHMGMTSGAVKGTRMNRASVEEAMHSTPWLSGVVAKWFHQDENGDYIFDGLKGGVNLTKPQMEQMMELARDRVAVQRQVLNTMSQAPGFDTSTALPPGVAATGGFTATKQKVKAPPVPPSGGGAPPTPPAQATGSGAAPVVDPYEGRTATGPNGHKIKRTKGQWVDAATGAPIQ